MAKQRSVSRGEPAGSLTGAERVALDVTAVPHDRLVDMLDAVVDADAYLSWSSYDHGRTVRVALQVRGARYDEYCRDVQHLTSVVEAVTAKCMGDESMRTKAGSSSPA